MSNNVNRPTLIECKRICKSFPQGSGELRILKSIDLKITEREAICIMGASGAGKSTLLHILGTLDRPSEGELFFEGENVLIQSDEALAHFRNQMMGFVFQFHHLLNEFTAVENVAMPLRIRGVSARASRLEAEAVLKGLGLSDRMHHFPSQMSGGEQQRVAIARAIINRPRILFADEPTGNLDSSNGQLIQDVLFELWRSLGMTLVVVTHDQSMSRRFPRILTLHDGRWIN